MSNHVHWVFKLFEKDENNQDVYLQDILQSVKRFSAAKINKREGLQGNLWQKESYDTTIRNERHLYKAIEYTKNNPVNARLVTNWFDWKGSVLFE
jgi:REP element-mobilizing transposase RayT